MRCGCSSSCSCVVNGTPCVKVTGNGSAADPYVVTAVVDPDSGNLLECGDRGLRAALALIGVDTDCLDVTVAGRGLEGDPYTITIDPIIATQAQAGGTNFLSCTEDGLQVPLSNDAGNTTTMGTDGGIFTPGGEVDVIGGCGINVVGNEISVAALSEANWPFPCDITSGQRIYCADDGTLWLPPAHHTIRMEDSFSAEDPIDVDATTAGGTVVNLLFDRLIDIVNPSDCYDLVLEVRVELVHCRLDVMGPDRFNATIGTDSILVSTGNNFADGHVQWSGEAPDAGLNQYDSNSGETRTLVIPAGGTDQIQWRGFIQGEATYAGQDSVVNGYQARITIFGSTTQ